MIRPMVFAILLGLLPATVVLAVAPPNKSENSWVTTGFTKKNLLRSAELAAQYLQRIQLPDGDFVYVKDPMGNCCRQKPSYSMVRHFGAVYALLRLAEVKPDPSLIASARRGLLFAVPFAKPHGRLNLIKGLKSKISLGELGFFLMDAMLYEKLTGDQTFRPLADDAAIFIQKNLHSQSSYLTPGLWAEHQALIGLIAHYQGASQPNPKTLNALKEFLDYTVKTDKPSHWSQIAFALFAQVFPTESHRYRDFVAKSADKLLHGLVTKNNASHSRFIGSKTEQSFGACGAAARNEGLIASYEILQNDQGYKRRLTEGIRDHLGYGLQFQYGVKGHLLSSSPKLKRMANLFNLRGGIYNSPDEGFIRIDFVAHHIRAIVDYLENF